MSVGKLQERQPLLVGAKSTAQAVARARGDPTDDEEDVVEEVPTAAQNGRNAMI
jgi:hypothetical protein